LSGTVSEDEMVKNDNECLKLVDKAINYRLALHQRSSPIEYSNSRKYGQMLYAGAHDVLFVLPKLTHFIFQLAAIQQASNE
jgi:hypothetical protein